MRCPQGCNCGKHGPNHNPDSEWINHDRVKATFGKASDYQCYLCFARALDWAHLWRTHPDRTDPNSYIPLCRRDHMDYDAEQRNQSEKSLRYWQDPEYRAKATSGMSMADRARLATIARESARARSA